MGGWVGEARSPVFLGGRGHAHLSGFCRRQRVAEREGFEPSIPLQVRQISSLALHVSPCVTVHHYVAIFKGYETGRSTEHH